MAPRALAADSVSWIHWSVIRHEPDLLLGAVVRMITVRCTARALKRFGLRAEEDPPPSTTILGSWYATLLNFGPQRHVLCVSERTLLPVLVPARNAEFPGRLSHHLGAFLQRLGVPRPAINSEIDEMSPIFVGRTQSRSILGVMNDFGRMATYDLDSASPADTSYWLGATPSGPLNYDSPIQRTCASFGVTPPRVI